MEKSRLRNRPPQSLRSVSLLLFLLSFKLVKDRSSCHPTDPTASSDAHPFLKCECKGTHYFQTAKLFERFFFEKNPRLLSSTPACGKTPQFRTFSNLSVPQFSLKSGMQKYNRFISYANFSKRFLKLSLLHNHKQQSIKPIQSKKI